MHTKSKHTFKEVAWTMLAVCILLPLFFVKPFAVAGGSMEPTYHQRDVLIAQSITTHLHIARGEVLVIRNPHNHAVVEVKRVVGLPNEDITLASSSVIVKHQDGSTETFGPGTSVGLPFTAPFTMHLGPEDYMVLGDNRSQSSDSRTFGAVQSSDILGSVFLRL